MFERDDTQPEDDVRAELMAGFEQFDAGKLTADNAYDFELPSREPPAKKEAEGGASGAGLGERGGQQNGKADSKPATGGETDSRERLRDESGRFAKGEGVDPAAKAAGADSQAAKPGEQKPAGAEQQQKPPEAAQAAAASLEPAPEGIGAKAAQLWATASPEQREYIRETEGALAKLAKPMETIFAQAKEIGVPWDKFVSNLTTVEKQLRASPMDTMIWIAKQSGVDLDELADYALAKMTGNPQPAGNQAQIPPQFQQVVAPLAEQVAQLTSRLTERDRAEASQREQAEAAQRAMVKREVDTFAQANAHWKDVEAEALALMPVVLRQNPRATIQEILKGAYDRAVYANPDVRAKVAAEAARVADEQRRGARSRELESLTSHRGSPASNATTAANGSATLRDEILANWASVDAR